MAKRHHSGMHGYYEGYAGSRRQEMEDGGMISEDRSAVANLPQSIKYTPYPMGAGYMSEPLDDTIKGVDRQMEYDARKRQQDFAPKKV